MLNRNHSGMAKRLVQTLLQAGITNQRVLDVIQATPGERFLPEALAHKGNEKTWVTRREGTTQEAQREGN